MDTNKHFVSKVVSFVRKESKMKKFAPYLIPNLGTLIILGLFFAASATGAMPLQAPVAAPSTTMISYQGQLTDADGTPLTGTYDMHFALYDVPTGPTACWTEPRTGSNAVPVSDGLFNVLLGSVQPIDPSCLTGDVYLGITVGSDSEMTPRELLGSVPHALQASTVPDGSITTAKIADGAVTAPKMADGEVTGTKIASGAVTEAKLANDAVTTSKIQDGQVGNADLADNAVNSAKIQDGQVQNAELANGSVTPDKLDRSYVNQNGGTINGNLSVNGEVTVNRLNSPSGADLVIDANNPGHGILTLHDDVRIPDGDLDMGGHNINNATLLSSPGDSDLVIDAKRPGHGTLTLQDDVRIPDGNLDMGGNSIGNVGEIANNDHLRLTPGANRLVKTAVLRQDNTTNVYKSNQVVLTGWGWIVANDTEEVSESVNFGLTFSEKPVVVASAMGYRDDRDPGDIGDVQYAWGKLNAVAGNIGNAGFIVTINRNDGQSLGGSNRRLTYSWIAIGTLN